MKLQCILYLSLQDVNLNTIYAVPTINFITQKAYKMIHEIAPVKFKFRKNEHNEIVLTAKFKEMSSANDDEAHLAYYQPGQARDGMCVWAYGGNTQIDIKTTEVDNGLVDILVIGQVAINRFEIIGHQLCSTKFSSKQMQAKYQNGNAYLNKVVNDFLID